MLEGDKSDMKNDSVTESVKERECLVCVPKTESTYNNKSYEMKKKIIQYQLDIYPLIDVFIAINLLTIDSIDFLMWLAFMCVRAD